MQHTRVLEEYLFNELKDVTRGYLTNYNNVTLTEINKVRVMINS